LAAALTPVSARCSAGDELVVLSLLWFAAEEGERRGALREGQAYKGDACNTGVHE